MANLADRIRQRRTELGLSQVKLARRLGVSQSAVALLENGRNQTTTKIFEYAEALETSPEWLLYGGEHPITPMIGNTNEVSATDYFGHPDFEVGLKYTFIDKLKLDTKYLTYYRMSDDSMHPTISNTDMLVFDSRESNVLENSIYIIERNGLVICRRVVLDMQGNWIYKSDSLDKTKYGDLFRQATDKILGKVVYSSGFKRFE
jgi:transcriptional regulator with XRE-family HTH domain